ncbi:MAG: polyphosphate kinase 2 family protein [Gammaproteobacteria bacterium]
MIEPVDSPFLVPFDGSFRVADSPCDPGDDDIKSKAARAQIRDAVDALRDCQRRLYAQDSYSLLLVFQAMDAAGKDSTIRAVMSGIDPAGCQVFSFKRPSTRELDHDYLWRTSRCLPERGRIGIFNRSYYEEVLVVRVHPSILDVQRLPDRPSDETVWAQRYESIRDHEKHLARNGTVILKFWLNVSKEEQRQRFLSRIEAPHKNWKFESGDVRERGHWDKYMSAYEEALNETSRAHAPWYAIPANSKAYMRVQVANIVRATLEKMDLQYPTLDQEAQAALQGYREQLENE